MLCRICGLDSWESICYWCQELIDVTKNINTRVDVREVGYYMGSRAGACGRGICALGWNHDGPCRF